MHMHGLASKDRARVDRVEAALAEAVAPIEDFEIAPQLAANARCRCGAPAAREEKTLPAAGLRQVVIRCLNDGPRCRPEVRQEPFGVEAPARDSGDPGVDGLEARPCEGCRETYQPITPNQKRCMPCRTEGTPRTCSACGNPFRSKNGRQERCNACKWDATRPARSPEQLALDAAVTPEMLAQAHAAKREDRTDLRPRADLLHAALERLTGPLVARPGTAAAVVDTALAQLAALATEPASPAEAPPVRKCDTCRASIRANSRRKRCSVCRYLTPAQRQQKRQEGLQTPDLGSLTKPQVRNLRELFGVAQPDPKPSPEPTNEEEPPMVTETPPAPAEQAPACACGCGQPVQRSNAPYNRGEWRKYATEECRKKAPAETKTPRAPGCPAGQKPKQQPPPPVPPVPVAWAATAPLVEQAPAGLPAFVAALEALLRLTPAQRQAALSAVAALEEVA